MWPSGFTLVSATDRLCRYEAIEDDTFTTLHVVLVSLSSLQRLLSALCCETQTLLRSSQSVCSCQRKGPCASEERVWELERQPRTPMTSLRQNRVGLLSPTAPQ